MSHNKSQISPIPPQEYGDRFVKFITGLTKTKEQAERESRSTDQMDGSIHTDRQASFSMARHSTDKVVQKAEKQAQKTEKQGASEDKSRDRILTAEKTTGATLPVVQEDGEAAGREDDNNPREQLPSNARMSEDEANPVSSSETQIVSPDAERPSGHKHLPSLPFIPRLSMTESTGLANPAEKRWSGRP